jgi:two-component system, OmpR family, alkaline phosphatase synthesis response regulator PhoP
MRTAHLLVVEDEPEIAALMRYHLERAGHTVATAGDGWTALAEVRQRRPDLLLLDLMLPDLDGFGICEILRRDPQTATLPILIVSAWSSADSRNIGLELGALDYLVKPFSPPELVRRVNHLLESRTDRTAEISVPG